MRGNVFFKAVDFAAGLFLIALLKTADFFTSLFKNKNAAPAGDILIIKFSALGDTLLLYPAIKALKEKYPDSKTVMIATKVNIEAARACGYIDEIHEFELKKAVSPSYMLSFVSALRMHRYLCAVDFDQWLRISAVLSYLSGASLRYGFRTKNQYRHYLYTDYITHTAETHEAELFMKLAGLAGASKDAETKLFFETDASDAAAAREFLGTCGVKGRYAVIHAGCGSHGFRREWPVEYYAEVISYLRDKGVAVVFSAGFGEERLAEKAASLAGVGLCLVKSMKLTNLAALIKGAAVFISGNTGIMHLAAACGTALIALHGPTDPAKWGPVSDRAVVLQGSVECVPCLYLGSEYGCDSRRCMESIPPAGVIDELKKIIK